MKDMAEDPVIVSDSYQIHRKKEGIRERKLKDEAREIFLKTKLKGRQGRIQVGKKTSIADLDFDADSMVSAGKKLDGVMITNSSVD